MAKIDEQLARIQQSVLREAKEKSDALYKQAEDYRAQALAQVENQVLAELYAKMQGEIGDIRGDSTQRLARRESDARGELLRRRESIVNALLEGVGQKLAAFGEGDDYKAWLLQTARRLAQDYTDTGHLILLRTRDIPLSDEITARFPAPCRVQADDGIVLGGLKLINRDRGILVDETLESRLEEQRLWLYGQEELALG